MHLASDSADIERSMVSINLLFSYSNNAKRYKTAANGIYRVGT